jgi:SAM-dependent methyltransferase
MSGFSATWLALREPADHRSRNAALAGSLGKHFAETSTLRVIDLGSGTGSNLRATAPLLGQNQEWTLVDYDPALLEEAARALTAWADEARAIGDSLVLVKGGRNIGVSFRIADLNRELDGVLAAKPDLVTASALFDLISPQWMTRFARAVRVSGAAFYTVLTYDGRDEFAPSHPLDAAVIRVFGEHQQGDKGFGPAAGPGAAKALADAFREVGYAVTTGESPWILTASDQALTRELVTGIAGAVSETGSIPAADLSGWLAHRLAGTGTSGARMVTGHTDILALPTT